MSNKELRARALDLSTKLGESLPENLSAMNNEDLAVLVAGLEERARAAEGAGKPPAGSDVPAAPVVESDVHFYVAEGKSITSRRGVLGPGQEMVATDVSGLNNEGKLNPAQLLEQQNKQLEYLASRGHLTKR